MAEVRDHDRPSDDEGHVQRLRHLFRRDSPLVALEDVSG